MQIMVIKRDGSKEPFEFEKITRVAQAAGLRPIDAEDIAKKIYDWLESKGKKQISSLEIRDKVFKELEKIDSYASGIYAWYQNIKDKNKK